MNNCNISVEIICPEVQSSVPFSSLFHASGLSSPHVAVLLLRLVCMVIALPLHPVSLSIFLSF